MASATLDYSASLVTNSVATQRAKFDWCAEAEGAKAAIKELLDIEAEAKAFAHALTALQSSYAPSERTTDFAQTLNKGSKRMLPIVRGSADMKQYYEEACSRLDVEDEQEQEEKFGSDDEVCIGGGHAAAANVACPLSGKPLMEIEDPVEDQAGYVYERYNVEKYIKEKQGSVECPVSATHHIITIAGLKRAYKVIRQQRHQKIHGTQQQSQAEVGEDADLAKPPEIMLDDVFMGWQLSAVSELSLKEHQIQIGTQQPKWHPGVLLHNRQQCLDGKEDTVGSNAYVALKGVVNSMGRQGFVVEAG